VFAADAIIAFVATAPRRMHYSYSDYLALEEESPIRHEYLDGEIYAMAGGTPDHAALSLSVLALVRAQLPTGLATYPDGAVVCGETRRADDDRIAVTNPILLIEVTSNSSEDYDRGEKLRHYQAISTLREVLIMRGRRLPRSSSTDRRLRASTGKNLLVDDIYRDGLEDTSLP
jgi:Uma2 family endonuclease